MAEKEYAALCVQCVHACKQTEAVVYCPLYDPKQPKEKK